MLRPINHFKIGKGAVTTEDGLIIQFIVGLGCLAGFATKRKIHSLGYLTMRIFFSGNMLYSHVCVASANDSVLLFIGLIVWFLIYQSNALLLM